MKIFGFIIFNINYLKRMNEFQFLKFMEINFKIDLNDK
jgi:hypothetical protein